MSTLPKLKRIEICKKFHADIKRIVDHKGIKSRRVSEEVKSRGGTHAFMSYLYTGGVPTELDMRALEEIFNVSREDLMNPTEWLKRTPPTLPDEVE